MQVAGAGRGIEPATLPNKVALLYGVKLRQAQVHTGQRVDVGDGRGCWAQVDPAICGAIRSQTA